MKEKIFHVLIWFVIKTKLYLRWSRLHQWLFQKSRTRIPEDITTIEHIMQIVRKSKWTKDKWWMAWDVFSHPEWAYNNYLNKDTLGDCDDHAAFSAYCLGRMEDKDPRILSVQWLDSENKFHGHNVTLYTNTKGRLGMISNGFGRPISFDTERKAAEYWAKRDKGKILSWCIIRPDLKKILRYEIGTKKTKLG